MKRVYLWGAGKYLKTVYDAVNKDMCIVAGIVDRNEKKLGEEAIAGMLIESPDVLKTEDFDYIVIAAKNYQPLLKDCRDFGIEENKTLVFWENGTDFHGIIDAREKRIVDLEEELQICKWKLNNLPYELGTEKGPIIKSSEELLNFILEKKVSLCRFGDGEFEMMRETERPWYQNVDKKLSKRLKEIINSDNPNIAIAVADDFGSLDCYTEKAANAIRQYLYGETRKEVMDFFDLDRFYYDAYVSRPYLLYEDKSRAKGIFDLFKMIWNKRELLIVEGENSKMGVGNDLFLNADRIRRIICPEKNAFSQYHKILDTVRASVTGNELVLVSLGPAATVLAYDLGTEGIQTLDIGQIDNEYEWFIRNAQDRIEIPGKCVAELSWCHQPQDIALDGPYEEQIIERIGI